MASNKPKRIPNKRFKAIVVKAVQDARDVIGRTDIKYEVAYPEKACSGESAAYADCSFSRRYLETTISVYPAFEQAWKDGVVSDLEVREIIFHEMAHVITEHMKELIYSCFKDEGEVKDAWESATSVISRIMLKAHGK